VGTYFEYGSWLKQCQAQRITLCYKIDNPASLIERLVELEEIPTAFSLDFSFPSRNFRDAVGVAGWVEYAPVNVCRFRSVRTPSFRSGPMVIGRHSRDDRLKFHPNDPAFMGLPVVLFGERVGVAELLEHGRNGFIVETEEEALACIGQLADDPDLRRAIGEAARTTLAKVMEAQMGATLGFYLQGDKTDSSAAREFQH